MQIKLGLECPNSWLPEISRFVDYDYVLVERAVKDPSYYEYLRYSKKPKILNNRTLKGLPLSVKVMYNVWENLGGEIIAPDYMGDPYRTFKCYEESCKIFGESNVIGVIQGIEEDIIVDCLSLYGEKIAVPFDVGSTKEEDSEIKVQRRVNVVRKLSSRKIHLLGLTDWRELSSYWGSKSVVSLNTGLPILLAMQGKYIEDFKENKRNSSYHSIDFDSGPMDYGTFKLVSDNITFLRRLLGSEKYRLP